MMLSDHLVGYSPDRRIVLNISCRALNQGGGKHFKTSLVILSVPADLPCFNFEIASTISGKEISDITSSFTYIWSVFKLSSEAVVLLSSILLVGLLLLGFVGMFVGVASL